MKRRWIVPLDNEGRAEIIVTREGRIWIDVVSERHWKASTTVVLSEEQRLDLIKVLQDAGRSRAGIKMPKPITESEGAK